VILAVTDALFYLLDSVGHFAWPISVCVLIFALFVLFRKTISSKLGSLTLKKLGGAEFDTTQPEAQKKAIQETPVSALEDPLRLFDNQIILDEEKRIFDDLERRTASFPDKKIPLLIRALAISRRFATYENFARLIFRSQYELLKHLNSFPGYVTADDLKYFFDQSTVSGVAGFSYQDYLRFLEANFLIFKDGSKISITPKGTDFLTWCVAAKEPVRNTL
jgi:hypothetical protein